MNAGILLVAILAMGPGKQIGTVDGAEQKLSRTVPAFEAVLPRFESEPRITNLVWRGDQLRLIRASSHKTTWVHPKGKTRGRDKNNDGGDTGGDTGDGTGSTEPTDPVMDADPVTDPVEIAANSSVCTQQAEYFPDDFAHVIEDFDQTETLRLDGPEWDNTLIRNCRIHDTSGDGIYIRDVRNVVVTGCEIFNVPGKGIKTSSTGSTFNVTIDGNYIHDTGNTGISAGQRSGIGVDHLNLRILNNRIEATGLSAESDNQHPIYVQAQDFLIEGNAVVGIRDGNGISIRSSGVVRCNTVSGFSRNGKPAIRYYSDHQVGLSNLLLIERNELTNDRIGIDLYRPVDRYDGQPPPDHVVKNFVIRYNTITAPEDIRIPQDYDTSPYSVTIHDNQ